MLKITSQRIISDTDFLNHASMLTVYLLHRVKTGQSLKLLYVNLHINDDLCDQELGPFITISCILLRDRLSDKSKKISHCWWLSRHEEEWKFSNTILIEVQQNSIALITLLQSEQLRTEVQSPFKTADVLWNFDKSLHAIKNFRMMVSKHT